LAGIFVLGVGTGVTVDSAINTNPKDLASRDAIARAAPDSELCQQYGSSAMVMDQRVFVSFNPFNVFVTQADTKPGCVLRPSNVVPVLQNRGLLEKVRRGIGSVLPQCSSGDAALRLRPVLVRPPCLRERHRSARSSSVRAI